MLSNNSLMKNKRRKGFSLLEIVVSLGLIALLIIPMGNMVMGTVKINKAAENKQQASAVLQETVEYIKGVEKLPDPGESIPLLKNDVIVTRAADKVDPNEKFPADELPVSRWHFEVSTLDPTKYGFTVNGDIYGQEVIKNQEVIGDVITDLKNTWVDGVILYDKNAETNTENVSISNSNHSYTIENALKLQKHEYTTSKSNSIDIEKDKNIIEVEVDINNGSDYEKDFICNHNALLIILDTEVTDEKLRIELDDVCEINDLTIYIYNKNKKFEMSDIEIIYDDCKDREHDHSSIFKEVGSKGESIVVNGINKYTIYLDAEKNGNKVENLTLDFIK